MDVRRTLPLMFLLLMVSAATAGAQLAPAPDAAPVAPGSLPSGMNAPGLLEPEMRPSEPDTAKPIFPANANLVELPLIARGSKNQLIAGLTKTDCSVEEDDTPQRIQSLTASNDRPVTLGILLDTSLSQQGVLAMEQEASAAFLRRLLHSGDEAFVIGFDVDVTMLSDFASSPGALKRALASARVNASSGNFANGTIPPIGRPKGTLLYDAVELAAHEKLRDEAGRKVLVLMTSGVDDGSQTGLQGALEAAQRANVTVYVLLVQDAGADGAIESSNAGPMEKLARATGGHAFKIGSSGRKMQAAFQEIESELRGQYRIVYTSSNRNRDGAYRRIQIRCVQQGRPVHVQVRQGYYARGLVD